MQTMEQISIAQNSELDNPVYGAHLWHATRTLNLSRRQILNAIATVIYGFKGRILCGDGRIWPVPDVYNVFGDIDGRWISYYCQENNGRQRYPSRSSTLERRRLIDLYFRIKHPVIAAAFGIRHSAFRLSCNHITCVSVFLEKIDTHKYQKSSVSFQLRIQLQVSD